MMLKNAYIVTRNGDELIVPTDQLTAEELEKIATKLWKKSEKKTRHAEEIEQYLAQRDAARTE